MLAENFEAGAYLDDAVGHARAVGYAQCVVDVVEWKPEDLRDGESIA